MNTNFVTWTTAVQSALKKLILDDILHGVDRDTTYRKARNIILTYAKRIKDANLRKEFENALANGVVRLYNQTKQQVEQVSALVGLPVITLLSVAQGNYKTTADGVKIDLQGQATDLKEYLFADRIGIKDVKSKIVSKLNGVISGLSADEIRDADGGLLRARAEMYVRREAQENSIQQFKAQGVKLVWASTHADCSPRCLPWQGLLYSLDGTYGTTENGNEYQPLENATNILTPNGKWFNGLLGFNCRHRLIPYNERQQRPEAYSQAETEKRYAIDQRQRLLERQIRDKREKAYLSAGINNERASQLKGEADKIYNYYRKYCEKNNTVAMLYRTRVTVPEIELLNKQRR